jgi:site-specific recombinase XerD
MLRGREERGEKTRMSEPVSTCIMPIDVEIASFLGQSSLSENTVNSYRAHLNLFRAYLYSHYGVATRIQDIDKPIVQGFLDWARTKGGDGTSERPYRTHGSLLTLRACLGSFFNYVVEAKGTITAIPLPRVTERIPNPRNPVYLTWQEKNRFLKAVRASKHTRDILIFSLFLATAMRLSELLSITPSSLDQREYKISVRLKRGERRPYVVMGKLLLKSPTDKATGRKPAESLWRMMRHYIAERQVPPDDKVFNITTRQVQALALRYGQEAGITKRVTPHKLRHTAAVLLRSFGVTTPILQQVLHHKNASTTAIYEEVTYEDAMLQLERGRVFERKQKKRRRRRRAPIVRRKGERGPSSHRSRKKSAPRKHGR